MKTNPEMAQMRELVKCHFKTYYNFIPYVQKARGEVEHTKQSRERYKLNF